MSNPETHTCATCGYTWRHAYDGTHSCATYLKMSLIDAEGALKETREMLDRAGAMIEDRNKKIAALEAQVNRWSKGLRLVEVGRWFGHTLFAARTEAGGIAFFDDTCGVEQCIVDFTTVDPIALKLALELWPTLEKNGLPGERV